MKNLVIGLGLVLSTSVVASNLEDKLKMLHIPDDKVTPVVSDDKLYVVNTRYSSLINRHEVSINGGNNFTADSHLVTTSWGGAYRYHINPKWSVGARYTKYNNELSDSGKWLFDSAALLPDNDYAESSQDIFVSYNTTYGKLRIGKNRVTYFDQYVSLGYGTIDLASGQQQMLVGDIGLAFWLGKSFSSRVGVRNEIYTQEQTSRTRDVHNAIGYISFGYLFGEGDSI
jgi:outer membrane beta-barrel protein